MQVERLHNIDHTIFGAVVVSQLVIGWFFFREWRHAMHPALRRTLAVGLCLVWIVVGYGAWLHLLITMARYRPSGPSWVRAIGTSVEIIWGFLSVIGVTILFLYRWAVRRFDAAHSPSRRKLMQATATAAIAVPAAAIAFGAIVERARFRVREVDLPIPNLDPDLQGIRIAQISDLHVSPFLSVREAGRAVDMTNELKPHLTLVTGDLISEMGDPLDEAILELGRLRADAGVLGCLGNHEAYALCEAYTKREAARVGLQFLRHEARQLRFGDAVLNVGGVDFQSSRQRPRYLQGAEKLIVPGAANLLLSHNPDVFPKAVAQGWDAIVGGHTHGGQVTIEIFERTLNVARFYTPYVTGLYRMDGRSCYVTRGIGTIGMPVRVGETPEITLLRLVRA